MPATLTVSAIFKSPEDCHRATQVQMLEASSAPNRLPLRALNHVSKLCRCVEESAAFYRDVLGFALIKRPESFEFEGAW